MMNTLGIIQARLGSQRLPRKVARKVGGKSLLEMVVRRVTDCMSLDQVIVATSDDREGELVAQLVPPDVPVFAGPESDVLGRFVAALDRFPAQGVIRICADNPFIDPALIDRLVRTADEHPECDYISYCLRDGRPAILSSIGLFAEWASADALRLADRLTQDAQDREHVTRYIYMHPEKFQIRLIPVPPELDRSDLRLTVDLDEDLEHAQAIYEALGPEDLEWQRIASLLGQSNPMCGRMEALNRKHVKV